MSDTSVVFSVVFVTVLIVGMIGVLGVLMAVNTSRRHKHSVQMAELQLKRDQEVMQAEREAIQQTLREVGRELHDNVGQLLTVVHLGLNWEPEEGQPDSRLNGSREALAQAIAEVRRLGHSLHTELWKDRNLSDAICAEAERLERVSRVRAHVLVNGELPVIPPDTATVLYRVFQEIVNNALKHSGADTLTITFDTEPSMALTIADNGRGFHPDRVSRNAGLSNIERRCLLIHFTAHCIASPGNGCSWRLQQNTA